MKEILLEKFLEAVPEAIIVAIIIPIITLLGKWIYNLRFPILLEDYKIPETNSEWAQDLISKGILKGPEDQYIKLHISGVDCKLLEGYKFAYYCTRDFFLRKNRKRIATVDHSGITTYYILIKP